MIHEEAGRASLHRLGGEIMAIALRPQRHETITRREAAGIQRKRGGPDGPIAEHGPAYAPRGLMQGEEGCHSSVQELREAAGVRGNAISGGRAAVVIQLPQVE